MREILKERFRCGRDGLTIRGFCYRPQEGKCFPVAIVCHEFMASVQLTARYAKMFAQLGYAAFCFDFCGGCLAGSSDGKTTDMSVLTEVADLAAVVSYATALPYADGGRVTLMGCSQGGAVSALYAARNTSRVTNLILFYPALSIPDDARRGKMLEAEFNPQNVPERLRCGPMLLGRRYVTDVIEMDMFESIKAYHGNVLICHGDADSVVDISYSKKAYAAYVAADREALAAGVLGAMPRVTFHTVAGGNHVFLSGSADKDSREAVKEFLAGM